jgi:acyl CoA:acetate/3-ketoacid CoA transferase beta subunit
VIEVTARGLTLKEHAPGVAVDEILKSTEAELEVGDVGEMPV